MGGHPDAPNLQTPQHRRKSMLWSPVEKTGRRGLSWPSCDRRCTLGRESPSAWVFKGLDCRISRRFSSAARPKVASVSQIRAPRHLSSASKRLYRQIADDYDLANDVSALAVLKLACEALDRAEQARKIVDEEGMTVVGAGGGVKTHPAVAIERDSRLAAIRCLRELSLDSDYDEARPPRVGGGLS